MDPFFQERIYIIGPHGGKGGSVKIDNFTHHIADIFKFPDADPPIPYTELLFTAVPGYKRSKKLPAAKRKLLGLSPALQELPAQSSSRAVCMFSCTQTCSGCRQ